MKRDEARGLQLLGLQQPSGWAWPHLGGADEVSACGARGIRWRRAAGRASAAAGEERVLQQGGSATWR